LSDPAHILLVEDDPHIRQVLETVLQTEGLAVTCAANGAQARAAVALRTPDLIILDLGLPDIDGLDLIRELRTRPGQEILVISARDHESDCLRALDDGADDFLPKPFSQSELLARVRVSLRRARAVGTEGDEIRLPAIGLEVDVARHQVRLRGTPLHLTPIEFAILASLLRQRGRVITHEHLLREVWGDGAEGNRHYLRIYLSGLRRKLEENPANPRMLLTVPGVGYRLLDEAGP
jgi:two-component system KDP operon response regulator KdpE